MGQRLSLSLCLPGAADTVALFLTPPPLSQCRRVQIRKARLLLVLLVMVVVVVVVL